jgi:hypothetical protein
MAEQVAIIRGIRAGANDRGQPGLTFQTYITESSAAQQFVSWADAADMARTVSDIRELEGRPCWVETDGSLIRFLRLWDEYR